MKGIRFLLILILCLAGAGVVFSAVMPTYTSTVPKNVYGFLQADKEFNIYARPNASSKVLENVSYDDTTVYFTKKKLEPAQVFAVFVPKKNSIFFYVMDEENGFYKVIYNKKEGLCGWIKPEKNDDFWTLKDFYSYYGKKKSLYYLKDVDVRTRSLRSAPSDSAQALQGFNVTKNIKLTLIRGNWALVSIIDYEGTVPKIGFIKWRDSEGRLLLFPQMDF